MFTSHLAKLFIILCLKIIHQSPSCAGNIVEQEEGIEEESVPLEGNIGEVNVMIDVENSTRVVDRSDEDWVKDAVLDVAYYLRSHKFNDFDRRYFDKPDEESWQHQQFPDPPLRYMHWEVYKYCDQGFYECLAYLQTTVVTASLIRSQDTNVVMNQRRWEYGKNKKEIDKLDKECLRLKEIDFRDADPFKGPLERFQWRVSASYYMCHYSMQNLPPLIMFGERCDNFAGCLEGKTPQNGDPRADDTKPYQCAIYSFCPEVCCPLKKIKDLEECLDYPKNPCYWEPARSKRQCAFDREKNTDLFATALNQWNVTCQCEPGYEWESVYGACVDVDECAAATHNCTPGAQTCLNLRGRYACVCAWGYINVTGTCVPNTPLTKALSALHEQHHPPPEGPPPPFSIFKFLFNWHTSVFGGSKKKTPEEFALLRMDENSTNQILFNA